MSQERGKLEDTERETLLRRLEDSTRRLIEIGEAIGSCNHDRGIFICETGDCAIDNQVLLREYGRMVTSYRKRPT
jgi:hypothetical protein